jgi:large subunit ribosomal protein L13
MAQKIKNNETLLLTKEQANSSRKWFVLDASGKTLGRFAAEVAKVLRGKHKPDFTPYVDSGDGVVIINAEKIVVTGAKDAQKIYRYHTGAMSGMREVPYRTMLARKPTYIIWHAVKGMMPKTRLTEAQMKKLRVYAGDKHDMNAQRPVAVNI